VNPLPSGLMTFDEMFVPTSTRCLAGTMSNIQQLQVTVQDSIIGCCEWLPKIYATPCLINLNYKKIPYNKMVSKSVILGVVAIATVLLLLTTPIVANHQTSAYYYHGKHYRYYHNGEYFNHRFPVDNTHYYCYGTYTYCHY
jgi:hypothetical protein